MTRKSLICFISRKNISSVCCKDYMKSCREMHLAKCQDIGTGYLFTFLGPENICSGDNQFCFPHKNQASKQTKLHMMCS